MRERPIIFNAEMVRAILDGRKTQTRMVIKPQPPHWTWNTFSFDERCIDVRFAGNEKPYFVICPYGVPGDRLWVRETWCEYGDVDYDDQVLEGTEKIYYRADNPKFPYSFFVREGGEHKEYPAWNPSTHMPRWASRILLEIINVRVEQVQEISLDDCIQEGVPQFSFARGALSDNPPDPRWKFIELWDSINAKRGYPWSSNPWVWVIEFKIVEK